jgi:hypothetical protein
MGQWRGPRAPLGSTAPSSVAIATPGPTVGCELPPWTVLETIDFHLV